MRKTGRGAQKKLNNKFERLQRNREWNDGDADEYHDRGKTSFTAVHPKTIINKVNSPDLGLMYSMNPYQGCEHGCIYCYARNSHEYWGLGAGLDFETKIMIKRNAASLLEEHLRKPQWEANTIMLSGNTDCYQPIESKEQITRRILEVFWKYKHPVGVITKNALIQRDSDILQDLASKQLTSVLISITSLQEEVRRLLEPRTASVKQKLKTIEVLRSKNVPVQLMLGPVIPGLNDHEIFSIAEAAANHGAQGMVFTVVHLNGHIGELFTNWIHQAFPSKAKKVLSLIRQMHNGKLNDSRWGIRKRGEGELASMIHRQISLAKAVHFNNVEPIPAMNLELHKLHKSNQLNLFGSGEF